VDRFLPSYDDPIVSIILLLGIVFIVSVITYAYSIWKQDKRYKELIGFLDNFNSKECLLDTESLPFEDSMKKPLFLLALAYEKSGEYSKSVNIYSYLFKHTKDESFLKHLAQAYLKAGFFKRAKDAIIEYLKNHPRDMDALYKLEYIYEKLNMFKEAYEVLDILALLNEDVKRLKLNLIVSKLNTKSLEEKKEILLKLINDTKKYKWVVLRELFKIEPELAWSYYKKEDFKKLVDILYKLKKEQIDLDIISNDFCLNSLYFIKGYLNKNQKGCDIFAINLVASAKEANFNKARLNFIYICSRCKQKYPLYFNRCPNCHRAFKAQIEITIGENIERGYSLL
jgi:tetratricopeptide (TPR) repeat protein